MTKKKKKKKKAEPKSNTLSKAQWSKRVAKAAEAGAGKTTKKFKEGKSPYTIRLQNQIEALEIQLGTVREERAQAQAKASTIAEDLHKFQLSNLRLLDEVEQLRRAQSHADERGARLNAIKAASETLEAVVANRESVPGSLVKSSLDHISKLAVTVRM